MKICRSLIINKLIRLSFPSICLLYGVTLFDCFATREMTAVFLSISETIKQYE
nr:MAG TPA: hypothetical protein [Bacteriophage sp.]